MHFKTERYFKITALLIVGLLSYSDLPAQDVLVPGRAYSLDDSELTLKERYWDIFDSGYYKAGVIFRPAWGEPFISAIRIDSAFKLITMEADSSGWYRTYESVPCEEPYQIRITSNGGQQECGNKDYSSLETDSSGTTVYTRVISEDLGHLLINLWDEMITRSRYVPDGTITLSHGYTYEFFSKNFFEGNGYAHSISPEEKTMTYTFAEISWLIYDLTQEKNTIQRDSLEVELSTKSKKLMQEILNGGVEVPHRKREYRTLKACSPAVIDVTDSEYCWQLAGTGTDNIFFVTADEEDGSYKYLMNRLSQDLTVKSVEVIPIDPTEESFLVGDRVKPVGDRMFILKPWDISDIDNFTRQKLFNIYAYRDYRFLKNEPEIPSELPMLVFDGIGTSRDRNAKVHIEGKREMLSLDEFFEN